MRNRGANVLLRQSAWRGSFKIALGCEIKSAKFNICKNRENIRLFGFGIHISGYLARIYNWRIANWCQGNTRVCNVWNYWYRCIRASCLCDYMYIYMGIY